MDRFSNEQVEAQNIISLFGGAVLNPEDFEVEDEFEVEMMASNEAMDMKEDVFINKIQNKDVSLEIGFTVLEDQLGEMRRKLLKTSFYLTDLENLLT